MKVEVVSSSRSRLGECPIWCGRTRRLYWVDSRTPCLRVIDPARGSETVHELPEITGSICLCEDGSLLAAMVSGVYRLSSEGAVGGRVAGPEPDRADNRFNDGRCDRGGRFWVGTMNDKERIPTGSLWRLQADGDFQSFADDIIVPNSLAFAPDNQRMYMADTYRHRIFVFDYDISDGSIRNRRLFAQIDGRPGRPDGSAIDADGCLWNAEYAGGRVVRYTPEGRIDRIIELPVSQPSCCAFGGPGLDELYITSASQRLSPEQLAAEPLAGSLFVVRPGTSGLPEGRFAG